MKFNDREITMKAAGSVDLEGVLHYLRPQSSDWTTNWYSQPSFKERKFKLSANLLFYYRVGETEPLGIFVLENFTVEHEKPTHGVYFPFSIQFGDEQRKYLFSCRCQDEANQWVATLKSASYEHWRTELSILQKKISMRTGQDPMKLYSTNQCDVERLDWSKQKAIGQQKSSFTCHIEPNQQPIQNHTDISNKKPPVTYNLIEF